MPSIRACGWRVLGLGITALGFVALLLGDFLPGQPAPKGLPWRGVLSDLAAVTMMAGGVGLQFARTTRAAAAALTFYFALVVAMNLAVLFKRLAEYGAYSSAAEQLAVAVGALIVYLRSASLAAAKKTRLIRVSQQVFCVCVLLFGGAHFVYMGLTAPLVPKWLPPSQVFWGYATGAAQIAAAVAILARTFDRLAAYLLTAMYAAFTPLVHLPMLAAAPHNRYVWSENALNLALVGAAWVVADTIAAGSGRLPKSRSGSAQSRQ